jgi:2-phosphosulfolactate phosphatase
MSNTVVIDCFPESASRYGKGYAVVVIDVIRATTTAITAVSLGRRCFPVESPEAAFALAARLDDPLLVGEQRGAMPDGFDISNSPAELAARTDLNRSAILLSSSGTRLCHEASRCDSVFLACLRNYRAVARHLAHRVPRIAVIGAGTRGEFREEDQMCCAWIAGALMDFGHQPADQVTADIVERWRDAESNEWVSSKSVAYLRRSGQLQDLDYILNHVDDLQAVFSLRNGEVVLEPSVRAGVDREKELKDA